MNTMILFITKNKTIMKMIKSLATLALAFLLSVSVYAQSTWKVDPAHAKVTFSTVHNTISDVEGLFNSFDAQIGTSKEDFSDASFEVTIDVNSIDTEVKMRDRSEERRVGKECRSRCSRDKKNNKS